MAQRNKYEVVVCNLGYTDPGFDSLDGKQGSFNAMVFEIKNLIGDSKYIDNYKITKKNYRNYGGDTVDIIETEDFERGIYLRKL